MRLRARREAEIGCLTAARVVQAYLDGEVDERTARLVGAHLRVCRRCGMKADTYRAIKASLARRGRVDELTQRRLEEFARNLPHRHPSG